MHFEYTSNTILRIDKWIKMRFPLIPFSYLQKLFRTKKIKVNNKNINTDYKLQPLDQIMLPDGLSIYESINKEKEIDELQAQHIKQQVESMILFEDDEVCVINKPYGISTQGGSKQLLHIDGLFMQYGRIVGCKYYITHRLDRYTTGVLILAKNKEMATLLMHQFKKRQIKKKYLAIIQNIPKTRSGILNLPLFKGKVDRSHRRFDDVCDFEMVVVDFEKGVFASTKFLIISQNKKHNEAFLELEPLTGRTHQIRVHLAHIGSPIVGDYKYGYLGETNGKMHLHSSHLTFFDINNNPRSFIAPIPKHINDRIDFMFKRFKKNNI